MIHKKIKADKMLTKKNLAISYLGDFRSLISAMSADKLQESDFCVFPKA